MIEVGMKVYDVVTNKTREIININGNWIYYKNDTKESLKKLKIKVDNKRCLLKWR